MLSLRELTGLKKKTLIRLTDSDQAFLLAGDNPVLRLKRVETGTKLSYDFTVEGDEESTGSDLDLLNPRKPGRVDLGKLPAKGFWRTAQ